jgi:hypothetical protein
MPLHLELPRSLLLQRGALFHAVLHRCTFTTLQHLDISVQAYQAGAVEARGTAIVYPVIL